MTERCKATTKAGHLCQNPTLREESFCLVHSHSKRAVDLRLKGARKHKSYVSREELAKLLSREIREADKIPDSERRMKIKSSLSEKLIMLLDKIEDVKELEKLLNE